MSPEIEEKIRSAAEQKGVDPDLAVKIASTESAGKSKAKNARSTAGGLFQVIDETWKRYGGAPGKKFDVDENIRIGTDILADNSARLEKKFGRAPSGAEIYAAHFFGPEKGVQIMSAPADTPLNVFLSKQVFKANPNLKDKTAGDIATQFNTRFAAKPAAAPAVVPAAPVRPEPVPENKMLKYAEAEPVAPERAVVAENKYIESRPDVVAQAREYGPGYQAALALAALDDDDDDEEYTTKSGEPLMREKSAAQQFLETETPPQGLAGVDFKVKSPFPEMASAPGTVALMAMGGEAKEKKQKPAGNAKSQLQQMKTQLGLQGAAVDDRLQGLGSAYTALGSPAFTRRGDLSKDTMGVAHFAPGGLVRQPQYDVRGNSEEGTRSSDGYIDPSTGEIFRGMRVGDAENGYEYVTVPTGQMWDKKNTADPSGKNIYGSQGYAPQQYEAAGDESGESLSTTGVGGMTPSGDMQIAESMDRKGYTDVLDKYGIKPKYDPQYGYVIPSDVHNAVTQEYFKNAGLGQYQERDAVTGFIDKYAVPALMAATGYGMASGFGGAAAAEGAGAAGTTAGAGASTSPSFLTTAANYVTNPANIPTLAAGAVLAPAVLGAISPAQPQPTAQPPAAASTPTTAPEIPAGPTSNWRKTAPTTKPAVLVPTNRAGINAPVVRENPYTMPATPAPAQPDPRDHTMPYPDPRDGPIHTMPYPDPRDELFEGRNPTVNPGMPNPNMPNPWEPGGETRIPATTPAKGAVSVPTNRSGINAPVVRDNPYAMPDKKFMAEGGSAGEAASLLEKLKGYGETAASIGSGLASSIPAGYSGLLELARTRDPAMAAQEIAARQEAGTYVPRGTSGKESLSKAAEMLELLNVPAQKVGEAAFRASGNSPLVGAAAETLLDPMNFVPGAKAIKGFPKAVKEAAFAAYGAGPTGTASHVIRPVGGSFPSAKSVEEPPVSHLDDFIFDSVEKVKRRYPEGPARKTLEDMFDKKARDYFRTTAGSIADPLREMFLENKLPAQEKTPLGETIPSYLREAARKGNPQAMQALEQEYGKLLNMQVTRRSPDLESAKASTSQDILKQMQEQPQLIPDATLVSLMRDPTALSKKEVKEYATKIRQRMKDNPEFFSAVLERKAEYLPTKTESYTEGFKSREEMQPYANIYPPVMTAKDLPAHLQHEVDTAIEKQQPIIDLKGHYKALGLDTEDYLKAADSISAKDLSQMSFPDFVAKAYNLNAQTATIKNLATTAQKLITEKKPFPKEIKDFGVKEIAQAPDGYRWVQVTNPDATIIQGKLMDNSIAGYSRSGTYGPLNTGRQGITDGKLNVFVLQDPKGYPVINADYIPELQELHQMTGNGTGTGNAIPVLYSDKIQSLFDALEKRGDYVKTMPLSIENLMLGID